MKLTGFSMFMSYLAYATLVALLGCYLHNTGAKIVLIVVAVITVIVAVILFLVILYVMVKAGCSSSDIGEVTCDYCEAVAEIADSIGGDSDD